MIYNEEYDKFWNFWQQNHIQQNTIFISLSFKKLFMSMVAHNPDVRPTLVEVKHSEWLKNIEIERGKYKQELLIIKGKNRKNDLFIS